MPDAVTLRDLMDERDRRYSAQFVAQEAATKLALSEAEKASLKAEAGTQRQLAALNELRGMASDQQGRFASREAVDVQINALREKLDARGTLSVWGAVVGLLVGIGGLVAFIMSLRGAA